MDQADGGRAQRKYGKLRLAYAYTSPPRESIGVRNPGATAAELDYNLWIGPAPVHPYARISSTTTGMDLDSATARSGIWARITGRGAVAMPAGAAPRSVISLGGRFGYQDQGQTPTPS